MGRKAVAPSEPAPIREVEETKYIMAFELTEDEVNDLMLGIVPHQVRLAAREQLAWSIADPHKLKESA